MGQNILARSHLQYIRPIPESDDDLDRLYEEFNRKGKSLDEVYLLISNHPDLKEHLAGMEPGMYASTQATKEHEFQVGSYGYYDKWREQLNRLILGVAPSVVWGDPEHFAGQPFVELIHFTDSVGGIGTRLAEKLAADFRAHTGKAEEFAATLDDHGSFIFNYLDFTRAFELAARKGALVFC